MRPEYQLIPDKQEKSFVARRLKRQTSDRLSDVWHYHPEIEICFTQKGKGKRFVGNDIDYYQEGDIVMLGSNLPHGFMTSKKCIQVVILFDQDFLGDNFFEKPDLSKVKTLIGKAKNGLQFKGASREKGRKLIYKILRKEGLEKTIHFLELLNLLANSNEVEFICNAEYVLDPKTTTRNRIKLVYNYIMENYTRSIKVSEVASMINMTEASFFKFIKRHTHKTFTQMINEFRINHASKLLMTTDKSVAETCYECGYNNISYFNRKFKEIMHETPGSFRKIYKDSALPVS